MRFLFRLNGRRLETFIKCLCCLSQLKCKYKGGIIGNRKCKKLLKVFCSFTSQPLIGGRTIICQTPALFQFPMWDCWQNRLLSLWYCQWWITSDCLNVIISWNFDSDFKISMCWIYFSIKVSKQYHIWGWHEDKGKQNNTDITNTHEIRDSVS